MTTEITLKIHKIVISWMTGEYTTHLQQIAAGSEEPYATVVRYLMGDATPDDLVETGYDHPGVSDGFETAINEVEGSFGPYSVNRIDVLERLASIAYYRSQSWDVRDPYKVSFPQALHILVRNAPEFVRDLSDGRKPHCPVYGRWEYMAAAIILVNLHPEWQKLRGNFKAAVGFSHWRAGLEVGNGSTMEFMGALGLDIKELDDDAVMVLAVLGVDTMEAGRRNLKVPYMNLFQQRDWEWGRERGEIMTQAPEVMAALDNGRLSIAKGIDFYKKYQGNAFVLGWIDDRVQDKQIDDPADPFGPKVSVWELEKAKLNN